MCGRVFASGGEAYFALAMDGRLGATPVLPEATLVGALSAQGLNIELQL